MLSKFESRELLYNPCEVDDAFDSSDFTETALYINNAGTHGVQNSRGIL